MTIERVRGHRSSEAADNALPDGVHEEAALAFVERARSQYGADLTELYIFGLTLRSTCLMASIWRRSSSSRGRAGLSKLSRIWASDVAFGMAVTPFSQSHTSDTCASLAPSRLAWSLNRTFSSIRAKL